jgi:glycosyltransferase involved in cell wall biosynthesis
MKILHTENSLGWGGQEIRILSEIEGMRGRGHEMHLICPAEARIFGEAARRGIAVTALPIQKKRLRGVQALRAWLAANPVDVINTHSSTDSWLTALACATLQAAPPIVRTRHISAPVSNNLATRWLYTRATRSIVTTGEALKTRLVEDNGFPPECIVSIPTGIDLARYLPVASSETRQAVRARLGLPPAAHIIGIVATLRSWKGHRYLVEAFASLKRADTHLLIVGDGPQRAALEELVGRLGIASQVTLAGNQADVVPWLQSIEVFCLPSYANEGVPQAILQAFACALPVVTTNAGAIGEVARDGDTALVVRMEDAADLARGIGRMLDDPAHAQSLATRAHALAQARFSLDAMLDQMETVFHAATDQARK